MARQAEEAASPRAARARTDRGRTDRARTDRARAARAERARTGRRGPPAEHLPVAGREIEGQTTEMRIYYARLGCGAGNAGREQQE